MLRALAFYKDLVDSGAAPSGSRRLSTYDDFNAAALSDTIAMFEGGHWQYFQIKEAVPAEEFAKWEVSELPGPTPANSGDRNRRLDARSFQQGP